MNSIDSMQIPTSLFPSIWRGTYSSAQQWHDTSKEREGFLRATEHLDDGLLHPRRVSTEHAWCAACEEVTEMIFHWHFAAPDPDGSVHPAWTEIGECSGCGLNSRMRALVALLKESGVHGTAFIAEAFGPSHAVVSSMFETSISSEFLDPSFEPGSIHPLEIPESRVSAARTRSVRHEDLTRLSLDSQSVDVVITQDVFEHIPDYRAAIGECCRILRPGGFLVFTIPFFPEISTTEVRALVHEDGSVEHLTEPEIHGNPLGDGSLCFQHFGWDLLDDLRTAGFSRADAHSYWGPWQGHVLGPSFVFSARR